MNFDDYLKLQKKEFKLQNERLKYFRKTKECRKKQYNLTMEINKTKNNIRKLIGVEEIDYRMV